MIQISGELLEWFAGHARILPWRDDPTPYHVWVSEVMLQQTRVEAVLPYFQRFVVALPDIATLAAVEEDALLKLWEGLGYYSRARNLKKAALLVLSDFGGALPGTPEQLQTLPGIGPYTAGAIASIAFGKKVPAVDGNVLRVLSRLLAFEKDIALGKQELSDQLILPDQIGDFNQALMELGALVCLPNGQPRCEQCPLPAHCKAYAQGNVLGYPIKAKKKPKKIEHRTIFLLESDGAFALFRRKSPGLLAGMYEYLNQEGVQEPDQFAELGIESAIRLPDHRHLFTHLRWELSAYHLVTRRRFPGAVYASRPELERRYPLPGALAPYTKYLLKKDGNC